MITGTELLKPGEAAALLRVRERTLADWRLRGVGRRYICLTGRGVRYRQRDIDAWLTARERTSTSTPARVTA